MLDGHGQACYLVITPTLYARRPRPGVPLVTWLSPQPSPWPATHPSCTCCGGRAHAYSQQDPDQDQKPNPNTLTP
eukprot:scaffold95300_cov27-Phaeocystis_antarctica.AAC.2